MSLDQFDVKFDNRNLNEKIYMYLRDLIVTNVLKPGMRLDYNTLSKKLGVSKTPLRDAFHFLQQDGLVEIRSRSGTYVAIPQVKDIEEIYDVRKAIERQAISYVAEKMPKKELQALLDEVEEAERAIERDDFQPFFDSDRNLHYTIMKYSDNSRLIKIFHSIQTQIAWLGVMIAKNSDRPSIASKRHKEILVALLDDDIPTAQHLMETHIEEIKQMTLEDFK